MLKYLLGVVFFIAASCGAAVDMSVLGIKLNEPLAVPECERNPSGTGYAYNTTTCFIYGYRIDKNTPSKLPDNIKVEVKIPIAEQPNFFSNYLVCQIINGKVQYITFDTPGYKYQEEILGLMVKKYGEPTTLKENELQNSYGAKYSVLAAEWKFNEVEVNFRGATSDLKVGKVLAMTPEAKEYLTQELKKASASTRPL